MTTRKKVERHPLTLSIEEVGLLNDALVGYIADLTYAIENHMSGEAHNKELRIEARAFLRRVDTVHQKFENGWGDEG